METTLSLIFFVVVVLMIAPVLLLPQHIAAERGHPKLHEIRLLAWLGLVTFGITWIVALVWALLAPESPPPPPPPPPRRELETPGRFIVVGVDKATGMDTRLVIEADTAANAKVKAELKGVIVTNVLRKTK